MANWTPTEPSQSTDTGQSLGGPPSVDRPNARVRVLLMGDDGETLRAAARGLEETGWCDLETSDAASGLARLAAAGVALDIVMLAAPAAPPPTAASTEAMPADRFVRLVKETATRLGLEVVMKPHNSTDMLRKIRKMLDTPNQGTVAK